MSRRIKSLIARKLERAFFPCTLTVERVLAEHKKQCEETANVSKSAGQAAFCILLSLDKK